MEVSVGDQIRVTAGFREGKDGLKNNDIAQVREVTDTELVLRDGRRVRLDAAIQRSNHALPLGDAPSGNSSRDGNGALDLAVPGAATGKCGPPACSTIKEVVGIHVLLTR